MHHHLNEERQDSLRPKGSRIETDREAHPGRAVLHGRGDVLDADAILGLQRTVGNGAVTSLLEEERSPVHDVIKSGGRPLEPDVREDMEARLGHDFSDVRVHDDTAAAASATAVNAHAYTVGPNVVFQRDKYDPSNSGGQDHAGPRADPCRPATKWAGRRDIGAGWHQDQQSLRSLRAGRSSERRTGDGCAPAPVQTAAVSAAGPSVQRHATEEEPGVQGMFVQRQEEEEEQVQGLFVQRAEGEEEEEPVQGLYVQRAEGEEEEETPA